MLPQFPSPHPAISHPLRVGNSTGSIYIIWSQVNLHTISKTFMWYKGIYGKFLKRLKMYKNLIRCFQKLLTCLVVILCVPAEFGGAFAVMNSGCGMYLGGSKDWNLLVSGVAKKIKNKWLVRNLGHVVSLYFCIEMVSFVSFPLRFSVTAVA